MQDDRDEFERMLRHAKVRVTGVRLNVLAVLKEAGQPLSAQQVFDSVAAMAKPKDGKPDRVTVYRTLNSLVEVGIAHKVDPGDRMFRFRLTDHGACGERGHDHEHPHFVCDDCGEVECMEGARVVVSAGAAKKSRWKRTVRQDVVLRGTCGECGGGGGGSGKRRK